MALLLSTNMYNCDELECVLPYLEEYHGKLGLELFPLFQEEGYETVLKSCMQAFSDIPVSFHGPYYEAEHSAPAGSESYERTMKMMKKTIEYAQKLNSRYIVFHHSNCEVDPKQKPQMIETACRNYREIEKLCKNAGNIPLVVENAGIMEHHNMLLNQQEFIRICQSQQYPVLIDIGHAHANGWNLSEVIQTLKDQIIAYHLHNNDGTHDCHQRIHNGTLDFDQFLLEAQKYTPNAEWILEYAANVADDEDGICEDIDFMLRK